MMDELLKLAERVEAAKRPDRELDADIERQLYREAGAAVPDDFKFTDPPCYTASLDAAMTLVPKGWRLAELCEFETLPDEAPVLCQCQLRRNGFKHHATDGDGVTLTLALTAAALRARAQQNGITYTGLQVQKCESCDNTDEDYPFCDGCGTCVECCNCTESDCDCEVCEERRNNA